MRPVAVAVEGDGVVAVLADVDTGKRLVVPVPRRAPRTGAEGWLWGGHAGTGREERQRRPVPAGACGERVAGSGNIAVASQMAGSGNRGWHKAEGPVAIDATGPSGACYAVASVPR
ncbi:hypothetical protein JCM9533A_16100 [Catenuloplanes niger JCM 9533]